MSDRPATSTEMIPDEPKYTGGWRKPAGPAWQPLLPSTPTTASVTVSSLPKDKGLMPRSEGAWHLPRPEHTIFTTQDMVQISAERMEAVASRPEDIVLTFAPAVEEALPTEPPAPEPLKPGIEDGDGEADTEATPSDAPVMDAASLLELERTAEDSTGLSSLEALGEEDDDDEAFSMSELIALSSLVEQTPQADIVPKTASGASVNVADLSPAERAAMQATGQQPAADSEALGQTGADDAAAYARRQLEQLTGGTSQPASPTQTSEDPGAYARRQLEQLGLPTSQPAVAPIPATLSSQQQEINRRFQDTENQVRGLRAAYNNGQLSHDQLREELRKLMILDEKSIWWMMGVETDTWYRFENNTWVLATPPHLTSAPAPQAQPGRTPAAPTVTSGLDPSQVIQGSLSYFPSQPVQPQPGDQTQITFGTPATSGGYGLTEEFGLPKTGIPIEDPERTLVGTIGSNMSPVLPSAAETLQGMGRVPQETLVNPNVAAYQQYDPAVPSPIQQDYSTAPDYALESAPGSDTYEEILQKQRQRNIRTVVTIAALGIAAVVALFACGLGYIVVTYNNIAGQYQPQILALANYKPQFQTARILDVNGNLIAELNSQEGGSRTTVSLDKISPFMIHALVSLENERYYEDPGWDWIAIGRAFIQNISAGQIESGASTITQQIAEQLILKQATTSAQLKLDEIVIASQIAQNYDKNFILQLYLNEVYFGNQAYGIEAASQFYFGHSANDLNLPEAAMLAGMISSPVQYNPVRTGDDTQTSYDARRNLTFQRMDTVIQRMVTVNCLQFQHAPYLNQPFCVNNDTLRQATVDKARVVAATYQPREVQFKYPHFVQFVQALVERDFGSGEMFRRGFVIKTTLNPAVQDVADAALDQTMQNLIVTGVTTGSVMVTDPRTGAIRAMIGSPDFNSEAIDGQVNGALTWQQPGSSIKPIVYTAALEGVDSNGDGRLEYMTPASILWDVPTVFQNPPYQPVNFDRQFHGPVALRFALQNSYNIPAVKAYQFIGEAKFRDVAGRMGLSFLDGAQFGLPTGIGATEVTLYGMMSAYGTLANGGIRAPLYAIESITDSAGATIQIPPRPQAAQVIQPQVAYLMENILSDDSARAAAFGVNGSLTIRGLPTSNVVGAKTGTTNDARDLWTMGFTQNAVVGVWLGRPDNGPTNVTDGGYGSAAPLWNRVMQAVLQTMPAPAPFTIPQGVIQQQICPDTGTLPQPGCTVLRPELFLQSQPPPAADQAFVQQVAVDSWTGLRANSFCPDNQVNVTVLNITDASAVQFLTSPAGAQTAQRLGITSATQQTVQPNVCDTNTEVPIARIISPTDTQTINSIVQITGAASATTFNRYQLEFAPTTAPNNFTIISGPTTVPQTSGLLGQWNTTTVANGTYILRLAMFSNSGGYLYRAITVNVSNLAPTAPALPTAAPLDGGGQFGATATPIPFDLVATPG